MAAAAFKSTSRRAITTVVSSDRDYLSTSSRKPSSPKKEKPLPRRSRSVSAVSRSHLETPTLLTTRDNPLFWSNVSPPDKDDEIVAKKAFGDSPSKPVDDSSRGRSASRNADAVREVSGNRKEIGGRSLSRVDTGRRNRSVSRGPVARGYSVNSESEIDQEGGLLTKNRSSSISNSVSNVGRKSNVAGKSSDRQPNLRTQSNGSAAKISSSSIASWERGALGGNSCSEAEEKTIRAVSEQMKSFEGDDLGGDTSAHIYETVRSEVRRAIADIQNDLESAMRRSNAASIATTNVTDIPPDLVNPSAVELVLDIRREYANKLEQSQERARKLRADLAVEEHRGLELSRILKEVLPDPKTSNVQKSRPGRKTSIERRRMSKRLTEEAMAYFDECVSLSTFDSSDFSSQEDPPINIIGNSTPSTARASLAQTSCSTGANYSINNWPNDKQDIGNASSHNESGLSAIRSSRHPSPDEVDLDISETQWDRRFRFSFAQKPNDTSELQQDIRKYVETTEKNDHKVPQSSRSNRYDPDEYNLLVPPQSLLFDRVLFKNRIESGSMLLCGGGTAITLSPFSSVI